MDAKTTITIVLFLFAFFALYYISQVIKKRAKQSENPKDLNEFSIYDLKESILTPTELKFYKALTEHISNKYIICPKVSLNDIFDVDKSEDYSKTIAYRNKINRKHVDFLVCDKATLSPMYGIELDDYTHSRKRSQKNDEFKNKLYDYVGLELVRIKVKDVYTDTDFWVLPYS